MWQNLGLGVVVVFGSSVHPVGKTMRWIEKWTVKFSTAFLRQICVLGWITSPFMDRFGRNFRHLLKMYMHFAKH